MIRKPTVEDAGQVAALMRAGMSENVRRITILGSPLLDRWVAEQVAGPGGDSFLIATMEDRVSGMASSRVVGDTLVLNHLYTHTDFQRRGIARALLIEALRSEVPKMAVDVFTESAVARRWYATLGFAPVYRRAWLDVVLPAEGKKCEVLGLAEADAAHARRGFSHFKLRTERAEYAVGRLAHAVFRSVGFSILEDSEALAALAVLDPSRRLLCIGAPEDVPAGAGRIVEESERLIAPRSRLLAMLAV